jgi:hypothetical protein
MLRWQPWLADRQNHGLNVVSRLWVHHCHPIFDHQCVGSESLMFASQSPHCATKPNFADPNFWSQLFMWQNPNIVHGKCSFVITSGLKSMWNHEFHVKNSLFFTRNIPMVLAPKGTEDGVAWAIDLVAGLERRDLRRWHQWGSSNLLLVSSNHFNGKYH